MKLYNHQFLTISSLDEKTMTKTDVIILGAGAAGLMCAIEAGKRSRNVIVLDHMDKPGRKVLMSGGGRCNFTNNSVDSSNYISQNPHFCKSALSRYSQWDFIDMVQRYDIPIQERSHGQLFCEKSSKGILDMLLAECHKAKVSFSFNTEIQRISKVSDTEFHITCSTGEFSCKSLVVATGGLSLPTTGASPFGHKVAELFDIPVLPTSAGLVPFTLSPKDKERFAALSGIAVPAIISNERQSFSENLLFTHRGLSGPAVLQMSSYWQPGEEVEINLLPGISLIDEFKKEQKEHPKQKIKTILSKHLPKRVVSAFLSEEQAEKELNATSHKQFEEIAGQIQEWHVKPNGTEGYRTAEVTLGGVDCNEISSKTMESKKVSGLFFIGEVLDVTGWLGGYNLQWAWSSGWCAGQFV